MLILKCNVDGQPTFPPFNTNMAHYNLKVMNYFIDFFFNFKAYGNFLVNELHKSMTL